MSHDLKVGIVNNEISNFHNCDGYKINSSLPLDACQHETLSCEFLNYLSDNKMTKIHYNSPEKAHEDYSNLKIFGYISISPNFTQNLLDDVSDNVGNVLEVYLDNTMYYEVGFIRLEILESFQHFAQNLSRQCEVAPLYLMKPIKIVEAMFSSMSFDLRSTMFAVMAVK